MKQYGDITQLKGDVLEPVDLIVGGSPCQDLSVAGKRAGLEGERSGLFMEMIRIIKEMRNATNFISPRWMLWENVPGAFTSGKPKGADFQAVLAEVIKVVEPKAPDVPIPAKGWTKSGVIMGDGWSLAWRTHDAQYWGVPQRRKRISLVVDFGGQSAPEILFERKGMSGNSEQSGTKKERITSKTKECSDQTGGFYPYAGGQRSFEYEEGVSPTLKVGGGDSSLLPQRPGR